jgi:hypothetical protein
MERNVPQINEEQSKRCQHVHSKLRSITLVATKVHVMLRSSVVLTWMCDTIELV